MSAQGFPVPVVMTSTTPDQEEIQLLSTWQVAGRRGDQVGNQEPDTAGGSAQLNIILKNLEDSPPKILIDHQWIIISHFTDKS